MWTKPNWEKKNKKHENKVLEAEGTHLKFYLYNEKTDPLFKKRKRKTALVYKTSLDLLGKYPMAGLI